VPRRSLNDLGWRNDAPCGDRRSATGGAVSAQDLSLLLRHATALGERRLDGRFGMPWESRPAPFPAGLLAIWIVTMLPDDPALRGEY